MLHMRSCVSVLSAQCGALSEFVYTIGGRLKVAVNMARLQDGSRRVEDFL